MGEAMKHTPGPWSVDHNINVMAAGGFVAFPGISAGFDQKANARLIAAAPELLEALQALEDYVCNNISNDYPTGIDTDSIAFRQAHAAIAKATGGAA